MVKGSHHTKESKAKIGKNPKCGFQKGNTANPKTLISYVGMKFGKLAVIAELYGIRGNSGGHKRYFCLCDCNGCVVNDI